MRKQLGATPKVLDLAYARTKPILTEQARIDSKILKVKIPKPSKRHETEQGKYCKNTNILIRMR